MLWFLFRAQQWVCLVDSCWVSWLTEERKGGGGKKRGEEEGGAPELFVGIFEGDLVKNSCSTVGGVIVMKRRRRHSPVRRWWRQGEGRGEENTTTAMMKVTAAQCFGSKKAGSIKNQTVLQNVCWAQFDKLKHMHTYFLRHLILVFFFGCSSILGFWKAAVVNGYSI